MALVIVVYKHRYYCGNLGPSNAYMLKIQQAPRFQHIFGLLHRYCMIYSFMSLDLLIVLHLLHTSVVLHLLHTSVVLILVHRLEENPDLALPVARKHGTIPN